MKKVIFTSLILLFACCGTQQQKPLTSQPVKASSGDMILLGKINRANLKTSTSTLWFNQEYDNYSVDSQWIKNLQDHLEGLEIKVFMGTWCEDSRREIPHFFNLLQALDFDQKQLDMYAMSEEKTTPENSEKGLEVYNVPTIIFFRNGYEINRFVEFPVISLESDLEKIIKGEPYTHSYE
jgi:thiol-disulfide isomerase/thioredoxin